MVTRIHVDSAEAADAAADALFDAGVEVAVVRERVVEDEEGGLDEALEYVVATPASAKRVHDLLPDLPDGAVTED